MSGVQNRKAYEMHAEFCKIFAHPIRLALLDSFRKGEKTVTQLQRELGARQSTLSQHLSLLRHERMVTTRKEGRKIFYKISDRRILGAYDLIDQVVRDRRKAEAEILSATRHV
ncbi:MAG: helix-turn-helix transcriptional regulator [Nitrososphaerota archaeon]|nr:helix-turn-helix transcriptional regulator [Nitrososphaerota archaeon]